MAVLYVTENPQMTTELYDKVRARLRSEGGPRGGQFHVAAKQDGGGLLVVEVWDSEASREQWSKTVDSVFAELGIPKRPQPRKGEVHNMMTPEDMARP